jgi:phosphatidate phosphatase LPIN
MKVGDAGEAFFVFETDEDIPPDLVTSPILQPTRPEEDVSGAQIDTVSGRFGVKEDHPLNKTNRNEEEPDVVISDETPEQETQCESREPEFLDLDAGIEETRSGGGQARALQDTNLTPRQQFHEPSFLRHSASRSTIQQRRRSVEEPSNSKIGLSLPSRSHTPEIYEQDERVNEVFKSIDGDTHPPTVEYHHGEETVETPL